MRRTPTRSTRVGPAATTPTSFVLSILRRDDGSEKDTIINLRASGELVINAVTEPIVHAANACAENLAPHERGTQFELVGEAEVDGVIVWRDVSLYLHREGKGGSSSSPREPEEPPVPSAIWTVPGDIGRRYARGGRAYGQAGSRWVLSNAAVDGLIVSWTSTALIDESLGGAGARATAGTGAATSRAAATSSVTQGSRDTATTAAVTTTGTARAAGAGTATGSATATRAARTGAGSAAAATSPSR